MSEILTQSEAVDAINLNYRRLQESRANDDSEALKKLFEGRMNEALDLWSDFNRFGGDVALTDTVLLESE